MSREAPLRGPTHKLRPTGQKGPGRQSRKRGWLGIAGTVLWQDRSGRSPPFALSCLFHNTDPPPHSPTVGQSRRPGLPTCPGSCPKGTVQDASPRTPAHGVSIPTSLSHRRIFDPRDPLLQAQSPGVPLTGRMDQSEITQVVGWGYGDPHKLSTSLLFGHGAGPRPPLAHVDKLEQRALFRGSCGFPSSFPSVGHYTAPAVCQAPCSLC